MKAISLWQPWASLVGRGKSIETRSWQTSYRGPIAIHAAKRWTTEEKEICLTKPFVDVLADAFPEQNYNIRYCRRISLPLGAIVAVATLDDCRATGLRTPCQWIDDLPPLERAFGNFGTGRFGWLLDDIRILEEPIPFRGAQGLFDVSDDLLTGGAA